jgi:hypothetical protein
MKRPQIKIEKAAGEEFFPAALAFIDEANYLREHYFIDAPIPMSALHVPVSIAP